MAGHSHWAGIKHKKEIVDAKRGKIFSIHSKAISVAAKGNPDPSTNASLRTAIEKAKKANMPKDRIEKAVSGGSKGNLEEIMYEAVGPYGTGFLIKAITDNKNRAVGELKIVLKKGGAHIGNVGWMFTGNTPNYPLTLGGAEQGKIENLISKIENLDDISEVYSNLG
jgi:YebC/PmpR family DNA-binding regulatory protein